MTNRNLPIIIYCTIVAFGILYEHQPLLPLLASQWQRSVSDTALLTTATMLPLAMAPLIYGYILERFSSRNMLITGFTLLLISQALLSTAPGYYIFLFLRMIEGLLLPAIFTSLMTYMSVISGQRNSRQNISLYIAATIAGGFCGRTGTGLVTHYFTWQTAFWVWSALAFVGVMLLFRLEADPRSNLVKASFSEIYTLLNKPVNRTGLLAAFLLFFVFAAMLNFLPFRMTDIEPGISTSTISLVYSGYLVGIFISIFSPRLILLFGSERLTLLAGCGLYLLGTLLFMSHSIALLFIAMFIFAAGMFTLHSVLSGYLNHMESSRKGLINGLYVSAYYSGGTLGSFLPGLVFQSIGWIGFCSLLLFILMILVVLISTGTENSYKGEG